MHIGTQRDAREGIELGADGLAHLFADRSPDPDFAAFENSHHAFIVPTRGRTAVGQRAGLLPVQGDPSVDIKATREILSVWKRRL